VENWLNSENVKYALNEENLSANKFLQEIGLQKRPLQKFLRKYNLLDFKQTGRLKGMINYDVWTKLFGGEKNVFMIEDIRNPLIRMANCCFPIPGDKIKGFIHDDKEIEIHHAECVKVSSKKYKTQHGNIAVNVAWKLSEKITQSHIIHLDVVDGTGILFEITKIIKDAGVTIINSRTSARNNNEADIRIEIESITWPVFHKIVEKLRSLKFVKKIWEETPVAG
jgi:GTP pyrophosphokinase